jgi:TonB family protein
MIASWMLYACLVSGLITAAAWSLERIAGSVSWPLRWVWAGALALSIAWPLGNEARRLIPNTAMPAAVIPFTITVAPTRMMAVVTRGPERAAGVERSLVYLWCALSAVLLVRLISGVASLQRIRGTWKRARVDGTAVRLSDNVGPAVVGLRSMDVVLPQWIMSLDSPLRAIVLCHEEEHRAARDPYLLFAAALSIVAMPWNVALWYQARRLRLAIEMDCDARVLRAHPSPERYGMLMLTIAQRRGVAPTLFAPMLSEPTSQLERRIIAMKTTTRKLSRGMMFAACVLAVGFLALAGTLESAQATQQAKQQDTPQAIQQGNPAPRYPDILRASDIEGTVVVDVKSDARGVPNVSTMRVVSSSHDLFTNAVRTALRSWHVAPNGAANLAFAFVMANKGGAMVGAGTGSKATLRVNGIDAMVIVGEPLDGALKPVRASAPPSPARPAPASTPQAVSDNQVYFEFQVEKQVTPLPGNFAPKYPMELRQANVEGEVLAQFVVDQNGDPEMGTVKILKSSHQQFTEAVLTALPTMRFSAAEVGGRPVKQLVQMPFQFNLSK